MKTTMKKISAVLKIIFGYGIMISLFAGGATFLDMLPHLLSAVTLLHKYVLLSTMA